MKSIKTLMSAALCLTTAIAFSGCRNGTATGSIDGVQGPNVSYDSKFLTVSMVFNTLQIEGGLSMPVPDHPNSTISLGPDLKTGGTLLTYTIAVPDLGTSLNMAPTTLPGGRPLPGVAGGSLPAISFEVPQLQNSVFYVSKQFVGFFVRTDFLKMQDAIITLRLNDQNGKYMGTVSAVGPDSLKQNAGVLVLLSIDKLTGNAIRTIHDQQDVRSIFNGRL